MLQGAVQTHTSTLIGGSARITPGHAGCRCDLSKPITVVQRGGTGKEKRWHHSLLCQFKASQRADEEGFIPSAPHPRGIVKHGGVSTFLVNGFQVRLLANKDGS